MYYLYNSRINSEGVLVYPVCVFLRVDPDSALHSDLVTYKEKEGKDHILLNFTYRVSVPDSSHGLTALHQLGCS